MSILVKGMKMPTECRECPLCQYHEHTGHTWCEAMDGLLAEDYRPIAFDGRHPDCPLEEADDGWIPCTDHLPEEYEVLCCDIRGEIMIGHPFSDKESETGYSAEDEIVRMYDCIAWIPLPKPYQQKEYAQ